MPNFFSNIPMLSSLPNPLNLFNGDDSQQQQQQQQHSQQRSTESSIMASPSQVFTSPITKLHSILARSDNAAPLGETSASSAPVAAEADATPSPRPSPPRKSSTVVIADGEGELEGLRTERFGRRRGLSVTSRASGAPVGTEGKRRKRIETYVLVKPPPTSAKNPLNLQVQLVVPARPQATRTRGSSIATTSTTATTSTAATSTTATTTHSSGSTEQSSPPSSPKGKLVDLTNDAEDKSPRTSDEADDLPTNCDDVVIAPPAGASGLKRTGSISSTHSSTSTGASSSAASAGGSGKRIVPLYNLAVHNVVQPTIVTDAGTDSKVAKFSKRALDITGVGILEPAEIWLPIAGHIAGSPRPSFDAASGSRLGRPASMISNMSNLTPAVTREDGRRPSMDTKALKFDGLLSPRQHEDGDGAKKFFGKIFKKRSSAEPLSERRASLILPSKSTNNFLTVDAVPPSAPSSPQVPAVHFPSEAAQIGHPTFGLSPAVLARRTSDTLLDANGAIIGLLAEVPTAQGQDVVSLLRSTRPVGYSWTVRKWAKKNTEGWAAHIVAAAAAGLDMVAGALPGDGTDEVVFDWVKLRVAPTNQASAAALRRHPAAEALEGKLRKPKMRRIPAGDGASPMSSPAGSRTHLPLKNGATTSKRQRVMSMGPNAEAAPASGLEPAGSALDPRPGPVRRTSVSVSNNLSDNEGSSGSGGDTATGIALNEADEGYDSDPEDSETPWACSVWVKRTGHCQLLATLTPAPHHPKVIGVLKMPHSLRSISLADVDKLSKPSARKTAGMAGSDRPPPNNDNNAILAARVRDEVALTEENLKDVVCVTAMWLVAREEFGGLGQKSKRKT